MSPAVRRRLATCTLALAAVAAQAQDSTTVYQQRDAEGRIVLSDRATPGLTTERTWEVDAPDAAEAARAQSARDAARREAEALDERLARQIEQRRAWQARLELERLRAEQARAWADAEQARAAQAAAVRDVIIVPVHRPPRHRPPAVAGWIDEPSPGPARERSVRLATPAR